MSRTILIAEDYEDSRAFMKFLVESYGYEVVEAADGVEAIEGFNLYYPDLILMDIAMPRMDGLAATKEIRKFEGIEKVPIIAVTAYGKYSYERAIEAGCNDLLNKPVDFDALQPFLSRYLDQ